MKIFLPTVFASILLSATLSSAAPIPLNGFAATVNGQVITTKEVDLYLAPTLALLRAKYPGRGKDYDKEFNTAQDDVLEKLIENKLVLSELDRRGADLPDHVIDGEVKRIITEIFNGNEAEFRKSLMESGMTMRGFKESQKEKILIQAFRAQQFNDVAPATPGEIEKHYKARRLKLRDRTKDKITYKKIFIRAVDGPTPEDQLALTEELATKLKGGDDFDAFAKKYSAGAFADKGGLWENQPRTDLSPGFAEVIFEAPENKIIGPLEATAGFTIVKVLSKDLGPYPPLSEVRERMQQEVKIEKRSERYKKWITTLKRNAMIKRLI